MILPDKARREELRRLYEGYTESGWGDDLMTGSLDALMTPQEGLAFLDAVDHLEEIYDLLHDDGPAVLVALDRADTIEGTSAARRAAQLAIAHDVLVRFGRPGEGEPKDWYEEIARDALRRMEEVK